MERLTLVSLGDDLGHLEVALTLESTVVEIFLSFLVQFVGGDAVEHANTGYIEAHEETHAVIDGNNDYGKVVENVTISSDEIQHWPPIHTSIDNERASESFVFIEVNQIPVSVMTLFLVD